MLKPLSTNDGQNQKGHVYMLGALMQPIIFAMAPGWGQVIMGTLVFLVLAFLSYRTVGNIPPEQAQVVLDKIDEMEADELVQAGRTDELF